MAIVCPRCGAKQGLKSLLTADLSTGTNICPKCADEMAREQLAEQERIKSLLRLSESIVVTTTHSIDGFKILDYLGIESVEYVIGTGLFSEITTDIQDFFGARSSAFEKKLSVAKQQAMGMLKFRAAEKGANAVVAIDLDYTEFSGNRIALIINGTLVSVVRIEQAEPVSQTSQHRDNDVAEVGPNSIPDANEPASATEEEEAAEMFALARQFAQSADHQQAASALQEIVRRFPNTQTADKARRTLQKSGINK